MFSRGNKKRWLFVLSVVILLCVTATTGNTSSMFNDPEQSTDNILRAIAPWYDLAWQYRKPITINNTSGGGLTDYQVMVTIKTQELIGAGKMQSDGADIRFTQLIDGTTLSYWIQSGINTASTIIWVKMPTIPTGSSDIYIYYGNTGASAVSSLANTFTSGSFTDPFTDTSKINTTDSVNVEVSGGEVRLQSITDTATYDFSSGAETDKWAWDVESDNDPPEASPNSETAATSEQYSWIATSDDVRWQLPDPGFRDYEWVKSEMTINEDVSIITRIDFSGEAYGSVSGTAKIYAYNISTSNWDLVGSGAVPNTAPDATITGSITTNFSNYIDVDGSLTWVFGLAATSQYLYVDYVKADVTYTGYTPGTLYSVLIPEDTSTRFAAGVELSWNDTEPANTDITYQLEYYTGTEWQLIPDAELAGNSTGFDTSPVDISSLVIDYGQIRLRANLNSSNGVATPSIQDWTVSYYYREYVSPEPELEKSSGSFTDTFTDTSKINTTDSVNVEVSGGEVRLQSITDATTTYDFSSGAGTDKWAWDVESDNDPPEASPNSETAATSEQYSWIATSDDVRWQLPDPGFRDYEWVKSEMTINEDVSIITRIDFSGEAYGSVSATAKIYAYNISTSNWDLVGSGTVPNAAPDATITGSITTGFSNYIDVDGSLIWAFGLADDSDYLYVDYVKADVTFTGYTAGTLYSVGIPVDTSNSFAAGVELSWNDTEPANTDITYQLEYYTGTEWQLIPDADLAGNSAGFDTSPVDISSVGSNYARIRLRANLTSSDGLATPSIQDWTASYYYWSGVGNEE